MIHGPYVYEIVETEEGIETRRLLGIEDSKINDEVARLIKAENEYIEKMAAAYLKETGVPASRVELVHEQLPYPEMGYKLYYRVRKG